MIKKATAGVLAASRRRAGAGTPTVLGYSTQGSLTAMGGVANRAYLSKFTLASAGTLTELHVWVTSTDIRDFITILLYAANGTAAAPGTRLAFSSKIGCANVGAQHLQQTGFSVVLTAADYWVGAALYPTGGSGGGSTGVLGESSGGTHIGKTGGGGVNVADPPDNPFGTTDTSGARKLSAWGVVLV